MHNKTEVGQKFDKKKVKMSLVPPKFVKSVATVMTFGAEKYGVGNWKYLDDPINRYRDALLRHLYAYLDGEMRDEETGELHLAHMATNIAFLMHFEEKEAKKKKKDKKRGKNDGNL